MLNIVVLAGRMKAKPDLQTTRTSGKSVCSFCLAVQRDASRQAEENNVDWINCVAWDTKAEQISKYFDKGDPVKIVGRLTTRSWEDPTQTGRNSTRYSTEVVVDHWYYEMRTRNKDGDEDTGRNDSPGSSPSRPTSRRNARFTELPDDGDLPF